MIPRRALLVTGSRKYMDRERMAEVLKEAAPDLVLQGGAPGADSVAKVLCAEAGVMCRQYGADWEWWFHAVGWWAAGQIRNAEMAAVLVWLRGQGWHVACAAFPLPGSTGTWDMVRRCEDAHVQVEVYA